MSRPVRVALLGCGVVGSEVARLLTHQADDLVARIGAPLELVGIAVRRLDRERGVDVPRELFTTDAESLVTRGDVDVVIEVIGGIEPARSLILKALDAGASVVTANKALLAEDGATLFQAAAQAQRDVYFEAAVAGAIPIIRPLRESLAGDSVHRVLGIVNGTCNYILDQMDTHGSGFDEALEQAQALGYAEPDPTADVEGFDAAAKAAILASLAFHTRVTASDVHRHHRVRRGRGQADGRGGQAARHLRPRGARRAGIGVGPCPSRDDPEVASAGQCSRCLQRSVRRERGGRGAHVLRPGCGRRADGQRGPR
jgi:homoserine dehydrogenase